MPHITNADMRRISAALFDLSKANNIPFFVFSFGLVDKTGKNIVVTFTGQTDSEVKSLFKVDISFDKL